MRVSRRMASIGQNVSMSVFVGFSVYGLLKYTDGGFATGGSAFSLPVSIAVAALIIVSIAGICLFGHQLDLHNLATHREEVGRKAAEAAKQGRRKPIRPA